MDNIVMGDVGKSADVDVIKNKRLLTVEGLTDNSIYLLDVKGRGKDNIQVLYSMGGGAFVNSFSGLLTTFSISGIHLMGCDGSKGKPGYVKFFNKRKISKGKATRLTFDGIVIEGYVLEVDFQSMEVEQGYGSSFTLQLLGRIK